MCGTHRYAHVYDKCEDEHLESRLRKLFRAPPAFVDGISNVVFYVLHSLSRKSCDIQ